MSLLRKEKKYKKLFFGEINEGYLKGYILYREVKDTK